MAQYSQDLYKQSLSFPTQSGVYLFRDSDEKVLYIGKALSLNDRIKSYFVKEIVGRSPGIDLMVEQAVSLSYFVTDSEIEALMLEAKLIRQHKPKYNILLRDDKSFALIRIDWSEPFPGVYLAREKDLETILERRKKSRTAGIRQKIDQQEFFGPYLSSQSVKVALGTLRKVWPFRDCSATKYKNHQNMGRGCLYGSLGLCPAPCAAAKAQDQESYRKNIEQLKQFLRGEQRQLIKNLEQEMKAASEKEEFELAKIYRDRLTSLRHLQNMAMVSRLVESSTGRFSEKRVEERAIDKTREYLPSRDLLFEGYDISNNQGSYAVGAVISGFVFEGKIRPVQGIMELRERFVWNKTGYRKFRIKEVTKISDVDMLAEVVRRRLNRYIFALKDSEWEKWRLPDMLVMDGGKGQLGIVQKVVEEAFKPKEVPLSMKEGMLDQIPKVGAVAKGKTRKKVDLYGAFDEIENLDEEAKSLLAEMLREEAHRFVIGFYRSKHRKGMLE